MMLGFSILFTGLFAMEAAVAPPKDVPEFTALFAKFQNPILGVLVGAVVTGKSSSPSSASAYLCRRWSSTGVITYASRFSHHYGPEHRHLRHSADRQHRRF